MKFIYPVIWYKSTTLLLHMNWGKWLMEMGKVEYPYHIIFFMKNHIVHNPYYEQWQWQRRGKWWCWRPERPEEEAIDGIKKWNLFSWYGLMNKICYEWNIGLIYNIEWSSSSIIQLISPLRSQFSPPQRRTIKYRRYETCIIKMIYLKGWNSQRCLKEDTDGSIVHTNSCPGK